MTKPLCLPQFRPRHPTATCGTTTRVLSRRISEIRPLRVREKKKIRPLGTMRPLLLTSPPLFRPAPKSREGGGSRRRSRGAGEEEDMASRPQAVVSQQQRGKDDHFGTLFLILFFPFLVLVCCSFLFRRCSFSTLGIIRGCLVKIPTFVVSVLGLVSPLLWFLFLSMLSGLQMISLCPMLQ